MTSTFADGRCWVLTAFSGSFAHESRTTVSQGEVVASLLPSHGREILDPAVPPDVGNDEPLTQYGHEGDDPPLKNATRSYETDVSLIRGRLSARDAASLIVRQGERYQVTDRDRVRHTTAGLLRSAGFVVRATPTRRIPDHVSAELQDPGGSLTSQERPRPKGAGRAGALRG